MDYQKHFLERYNNLNPEQKKAVDTIEGPVMVVAGPGMGKTELLSLRVANILQKTDTPPESILCLTFTDSAAHNMLERLTQLIGKEAYNIAIHTFHSFATEVINHNPEFFFDGAKFQPADDLAQIKILSSIMDNLHPSSPLTIPNQDFKHSHIRDIKQAISNIKKEGFSPQEYETILNENQKILIKINPILNNFFSINWRSKTAKQQLVDGFPQFIEQLNSIDLDFPESQYASRGIKKISKNIIDKLQDIYEKIQNQEKLDTKELIKFRNKYLEKDNNGDYIQKDLKNLEVNFELAKIYEKYKTDLYKEGLFDFDDMLIEVNLAMQKNSNLSYNYKEKFLYILVDEFQDTNLSQSQLLDSLIDLEITNNNPNIMVVGDDAQAIYKFQGANIENILSFQEKYTRTNFITLHRNYRSHQKILDLAKDVIDDCQVSLSDKLDFNKDLVAQNSDSKTNQPVIFKTRTRLQELNLAAKKILEDIQKGINPSDIAVLVKKHKQLNDFIKILNYYKIPIRYERSTNVLNQKYIQEIITILKYINSILSKQDITADEYLSQILSFEMFDLDPITIYKISQKAYQEKLPWLDVMAIYSQANESDSEYVGKVHKYLLDLAKESQNNSGELILDKILGISVDLPPDDEHQDIEPEEIDETEDKQTEFSMKSVIENKPDYLIFLSGLKAFIDSLRKYKSNEVIYVKDIVDYICLLDENEIPINDNSPYNQEENAVNLMTVYKAKGLEFEKVYILDCNNSPWNARRGGKSISLPKNTPFTPESDNKDDFIRVFFVALTRAKKDLHLFSYQIDDKDKQCSELEFILDRETLTEIESEKLEKEELIYELLIWLQGDPLQRTLSLDEKEWLRPFFETYKLSATNLFNYLDMSDGGPQFFLERNLLRFPQSKNKYASYGTSIHEAIARSYINFSKTGILPPLEYMQSVFKEILISQRLSEKDFIEMEYRGEIALPKFYEQVFKNYQNNMKVEVNFRKQNVNINGVPITGAIDQMIVDKENKSIKVTDLKTGKGLSSWSGGSEYSKRKLLNYRMQLVFYRLLIENSRDFKNYSVRNGSLMFVEPDKDSKRVIELEMEITREETDKLTKLIQIVYEKITKFDFPDTSNYQQNYKGTEQFIQDLLDEKI